MGNGKLFLTGRLREVLATERTGIKKIIITKDNENDIDEIPKEIRDKLEIKVVSNYEEVFDIIFNNK